MSPSNSHYQRKGDKETCVYIYIYISGWLIMVQGLEAPIWYQYWIKSIGNIYQAFYVHALSWFILVGERCKKVWKKLRSSCLIKSRWFVCFTLSLAPKPCPKASLASLYYGSISLTLTKLILTQCSIHTCLNSNFQSLQI